MDTRFYKWRNKMLSNNEKSSLSSSIFISFCLLIFGVVGLFMGGIIALCITVMILSAVSLTLSIINIVKIYKCKK